MDMIHYMAEIVLVSFLVGGVMGAIVAVHLSSRSPQQQVSEDDAVPVKVRVKR